MLKDVNFKLTFSKENFVDFDWKLVKYEGKRKTFLQLFSRSNKHIHTFYFGICSLEKNVTRPACERFYQGVQYQG